MKRFCAALFLDRGSHLAFSTVAYIFISFIFTIQMLKILMKLFKSRSGTKTPNWTITLQLPFKSNFLPHSAQVVWAPSSWSALSDCTEPQFWMTAVKHTKAMTTRPESSQEPHFCRKLCKKQWNFTFHLRLAYCLLKLSKLTTDNLFTMACLGFRGCRDTMRD